MKEYPLFVPPHPISNKKPEQWSANEAQTYYDWLLSVLVSRTDKMLHYFGESLDTPVESLLEQLDRILWSTAFASEEFVDQTAGTPVLTNEGHALAADMGLLTARLLISELRGKVRWKLIKSKSHASFNQPVLAGNTKLELDPISGMISEVQHALRTVAPDPGVLRRLYLFWRAEFSK